jgi:hypothetical protein
MKNITDDKIVENKAMDNLPVKIEPVLHGLNLDKYVTFEQIEKDLNAKILEVTIKIKDHYPELSKYLEEMPDTIPDEEDPEITLKDLSTYYESLNSLLNKYKVDYPKIEE